MLITKMTSILLRISKHNDPRTAVNKNLIIVIKELFSKQGCSMAKKCRKILKYVEIVFVTRQNYAHVFIITG